MSAGTLWNTIKSLLKDKVQLSKMMQHMVEKRIQEISKAEVEKAEECMRHYHHECSRKDKDDSQMIARAMSAFLSAALACGISTSPFRAAMN